MNHNEAHRSHRVGWIRAAVLGANDGIVSISSLVIGIAAAHGSQSEIMLTGVAGLVAGAMSMAAGEFVSVSSQADIERADLELEQRHLESNLEYEQQELAEIYRGRGLDIELAQKVAEQLMAHDALGAHARDELGIFERVSARPLQAVIASAVMFAVGAALPVVAVAVAPKGELFAVVASSSLVSLCLLGGVAAHVGGARVGVGAVRVAFWGALAMIVTAGVGRLFGVAS